MRDLRQILDAVIDGVIVVDGDRRVEFVNSEACRILETSAEAAIASRLEDIVGPNHAVAKVVQSVLEGERSVIESERRIERRFEDAVVADVAASLIFENNTEPPGVVIALRDRTIQQTLQERVATRERLSAFGETASGIAHEVKNPLGGIRGAAELLARRAHDDRNQHAAELIVREVDRISSLVDDLMVFTDAGHAKRNPLNIHQVLDDVHQLIAMDPLAKGVKLLRSYDPSIPDLVGDRDRLIQVFLNLARNALQALEGQGELQFESRMALDHRLTDASGTLLPTLSVCVKDDGPGIPDALLAKVMTPLFTTRRKGTGLGLAVARHWVWNHDGIMKIESREGEGTRVRVLLPCSSGSTQGVQS